MILLTLIRQIASTDTNIFKNDKRSDKSHKTSNQENSENLLLFNRTLFDVPTVKAACPEGQKRDQKERCREIMG